jgi:hypothetical protein|tara:strand:+ start:74 stop:268 length:195 start_codon:yes stop_codon:yes gene_type:complete
MPKDIALSKIESHEKLCRIMQKQTHDKITRVENSVARIEKVMLTVAGGLLTGMGYIIFVLIQKV